MQYPDAVRLVNKLAPEMRDGDPSVVLQKAATARDLPVSVLEKMAQIWNSGRVLEEMSGGNRGGTVPLIDIDQMVLDYTKIPAKSASAKVTFHQATDCSLPNFNRLILDGPEPEEVKAAGYVAPTVEEDLNLWQDFVNDAYDDLRDKAAAWKRELIAEGLIEQEGRYATFPGFGRIEADAIRMMPFAVKAASWITQHWSGGKAPIELKRATDEDHGRHKLAHDFTGQAKNLLGIAEALATAMSASELFETVKEAASAEKNKAKAEQGRAWPPPGEKARPAPPTGGIGSPPPKTAPQPPSAEGGVDNTPVKSLINYAPEVRPKAPDKNEDAKGNGGSLVSQLLNSAATPYNELVNQTVRRITSPGAQVNGRQQMIDQKVRGIQEIAGLQRLMVSDPVISKADPQLVADLFATIRRGSPEIAADPLLLKFQLREAIQYGGMPPDSFHQMQRIRGAEDDHRDAERREDKARYGFGGNGDKKKD